MKMIGCNIIQKIIQIIELDLTLLRTHIISELQHLIFSNTPHLYRKTVNAGLLNVFVSNSKSSMKNL